jgi:hypothetical protein
MMVSVSPRPVFTITKPVQALPGGTILMPWPAQRSYDPTPDGKLIGVITLGDNTATLVPQIRIVLNWFEELKQRVPVR